MKHIKLLGTHLQPSPIALGTAQYGSGIKERDAFIQMDRYFEMGGNFIDTARVYGDWVPDSSGLSEKTIGTWLRQSGMRPETVLSTKGAHPPLEAMNKSRLRPEDIKYDVSLSLEDLNTDSIDLYFLHRDDTGIPVGEIIDCLEELAASGFIQYYGCSNWTLERLVEAQSYAEHKGYTGFVCNQIMYSLATVHDALLAPSGMITMDEAYRQYHKRTHLAQMSYMSMANGYFHKRFNQDIRADKLKIYDNETNRKLSEYLNTVCSNELELTSLMMHYIMREEDFTAIPVASFSSIGQLESCMSACEAEADESILNSLSSIRSGK